MKCDVIIVTGMGPSLGGGHFQRMASLLWRFRERFGLMIGMFLDRHAGNVPGEIQQYLIDSIDYPPRLFVRDMRDSSEEEIANLQRYAPVCVIDDLGRGRDVADYRIDILPAPDGNTKRPGIEAGFLYGYDFVRSLISAGPAIFERDTDFAVYGGFMNNTELPSIYDSLLPSGTSRYILSGDSSYRLSGDGQRTVSGKNLAGMLLSSRVVMTHFGLLLYEANLAGCGLISLNPTEYHSALAEQAKKKFDLTNLGVSGYFDENIAAVEVKKRLESTSPPLIQGKDAAEQAIYSIDETACIIREMIR